MPQSNLASSIAGAKSPLASERNNEKGDNTDTVIPPPQPVDIIQDQIVPSPSQDPPSTPRVLLVDDNAINLKLLVVFAKRQKLHYNEALNGLQAFETYKTKALASRPAAKPYDFVLMDLSMPVSTLIYDYSFTF